MWTALIGGAIVLILIIGIVVAVVPSWRAKAKSWLAPIIGGVDAGNKVIDGVNAHIEAIGDLIKWLSPETWANAGRRGNEALRDYMVALIAKLKKIARIRLPDVVKYADIPKVPPNEFAICDVGWDILTNYQDKFNFRVDIVSIFGRKVVFTLDGTHDRILIVPVALAAAWGTILSNDAAEVDDDGQISGQWGWRNPPLRLKQLLEALAAIAGVQGQGTPVFKVTSIRAKAAPAYFDAATFTTAFLCVPVGAESEYNRIAGQFATPTTLSLPAVDVTLLNFDAGELYGRGKWSS